MSYFLKNEDAYKVFIKGRWKIIVGKEFFLRRITIDVGKLVLQTHYAFYISRLQNLYIIIIWFNKASKARKT